MTDDRNDGLWKADPPRPDALPHRPLEAGDGPPAAPSRRERLSQDYDEGPVRRRSAPPPDGLPAGDRGVSSFLGHDPATRKLVGGAVGIGTVLLLTVGGWSLFGTHRNGFPVIGPPSGPVREIPADPGGLQIMAGDNETMDMTGHGDAHLAPSPEQPDTRALARQYGVPSSVPNAQPAAVEKAGAAPGGAQSPPAAQDPGQPTADSGSGRPNEGPTPEQHTPAPSSFQDDDGAASNPVGAHRALARRQPSASASAARDGGAGSRDPGGASSSDHSDVTSQRISSERERVLHDDDDRQAKQQAARHPPSPVPSAAPGAGHQEVQLAALGNEGAAQREWDVLKAKAPGLLADQAPVFKHATQGDKSFVRIRIGGFPDLKAARAFCVKLHAQSVACTPAQF